MSMPDLNLLITLDVLLAEGSVARAAKRLRLSPSAMSRALARLREPMGDPLLVRAGRGLVPTPRALELRERVAQLVQDAEAVLRPAAQIDLTQLVRTFTLRSSEGFVENFGPALIARIAEEAPGVRLCFMQKPDKDSTPLRDGTVDLDTGVVGQDASPELRTQALFRDRFSSAWALARATDLIASVPERHTASLRTGMHSFALPLALPPFTVAMLWHPRMDADPAHRWLRGCLREVCKQ
jgi:DNA-binding transcriptional LysR family regulator